MFHFESGDSYAEVPEVMVYQTPRKYKIYKPREVDVLPVEPFNDVQEDSLKRLFAALVWQGLRDYYQGSMAMRGEVAGWFNSRTAGFGTFATACDVLKLDADVIRRGLPLGRYREAALTYVEEDGVRMCGIGLTT